MLYMDKEINLSKSSPNLFKSISVVEYQLMRPQYLKEIVDSLKLEKEELGKLEHY